MPQTDDVKKAAAKKAAADALKKTAATRMTRVIKSMDAVGNLNRFKPSKTQVASIIKSLNDMVAMVEKQLSHTPAKGETLFTLPD